jgi:hypothetical protein
MWLFFSTAVLFSCRQNPGADPGAVRQELRQREIVHLSPGQITERAAEMGDSLLVKAQIIFLKNLNAEKAPVSCQPAWDSACREIKMRYQTEIRRLLLAGTAPSLPNSKEKQLFEAYQYSRQHHLSLIPNLQKDGEKDFIYTKALTLKDAACTNCHSSSENSALRGKQGDTLGIALLRFPKKQVVMSFVE